MLTDFERVRSALTHVPAHDRELWLRIGMAVKSELGEEGFDVWAEWSEQADSFNERDARDVWRSIRANGKVTAGTLFHEAKARGWRDEGTYKPPPPDAVVQRKREQTERDERDAAARKREREVAARDATSILEAANGDPATHQYVVEKNVDFGELVRRGRWPQRGWADALLVPLCDATDTVVTIEAINGDGTKDFLKGGAKKGAFYPFGKVRGAAKVQIAEGVANAAVGFAVTGVPTLAAMDAGNLAEVAKAATTLAPNATVILLADNDLRDDGRNPGVEAARAAARSVGGRVAIPALDGRRCDFWDLWRERGVEAVERAIAEAMNAVQVYEPIPLPKLPPVPDLPADILPEGLRPWIMDASERARFAPAFMAVAAMVGLGALIGRKLGIRLKQHDDWTEYANVWGGIVGTPSALKSPAANEAIRPIRRLQVDADKAYGEQRAEWEVEAEAHKLRRAAAKLAAKDKLRENKDAAVEIGNAAAPEKPIARCYWTSNATVEKLGELAVENPNGLLIVRDELSSLLISLEDEQMAEARGFYLSGWSGKEGYRFDRILRGTTYIPAYALSIFGGIQPGPLSRFVRSAQKGEQADGLLQRLQLLVWPDAQDFEYVDRWPSGSAKESAAEVFKRADAFDGGSIGTTDTLGNDPPYIHLDAAAQALFVDWYSQFMQSRRQLERDGAEAGPLAAHFGKYPGLLGKLALILHVCDNPEGRAVSRMTLLKALTWLEFLEPHARRVYHAAHAPETQAAELLLARIRSGKLPETFKAWEITRNGWHGLTDGEAVKKACRLLFEYHWLIEIEGREPGKYGRPPDPVYAVNPAVEVR